MLVDSGDAADRAEDRRGGESSPVEIRRLLVDEAAGLVACFERCYGDSYVAESFYDEGSIRRLLAAGTLRSVVALSPRDGIVGHMAITVRHTESLTVDAGNTVVDPRYRGHYLAARLGACLVELCREEGFVGFHHYPTTAHAVMQKLAVQGGGIETGLMLGYIPSGTEYRELAVAASAIRHAATIVYQPIDAAPSREVFVPLRYRTQLESFYRHCGLTRVVSVSSAEVPEQPSVVESSFDPRRRLLRSHVSRTGSDLVQRVQAESGQDPEVVHVDLSLTDSSVGAAVEALRGRGFFFCGLLPEHLRGDTLRLQWLRVAEPSVLQPQLATDGGKALLGLILRDVTP